MSTVPGRTHRTTPSLLEKLSATDPNLEVWWDSSPLVFESWRTQMLEAARPEERVELAAQLLRLWDPEHPEATLFRGVTTNPPLSLAAIRTDPARWEGWVRSYHESHPGATNEQVFWALYKEIVRLGAAAFRPVHLATGHRYGHISAQVDPRCCFDADKMVAQALELADLGENVMIKVPGSREGMTVLRELTRRGISTNCTLAYTMSQFVAAAEAVQQGLLEARSSGVDLTCWKSVVTDMSVRWENAAEFEQQAQEAGVQLTVEDRRWASIAIFKLAHRTFRQRAYPSKMLICSVRMGPPAAGEGRCWHIEQTAGADAVFTFPPVFLTTFLRDYNGPDFSAQIRTPVPDAALARLAPIRYFRSGYDLDGIPVEAFDEIPALLSTMQEFSKATDGMVAFVSAQLEPAAVHP